jgi:hypothetical protein
MVEVKINGLTVEGSLEVLHNLIIMKTGEKLALKEHAKRRFIVKAVKPVKVCVFCGTRLGKGKKKLCDDPKCHAKNQHKNYKRYSRRKNKNVKKRDVTKLRERQIWINKTAKKISKESGIKYREALALASIEWNTKVSWK